MTRGAMAMIFRSGSDQVEQSGKLDTLTFAAVMEGDIYISEDDAGKLLGCSAEYIPNTQYAICLTEVMEGMAEEALGVFME